MSKTSSDTLLPATHLAHWPGDSIPTCVKHRTAIERLAGHMGFTVTITEYHGDKACTNCENEAKRAKERSKR